MSAFDIFLAGILSCLAMDIWQRMLFFTFRFEPSNWAMVGRWLANFLRSWKWIQISLVDQGEYRNELLIGWVFHYFVGILYAIFYAFLWNFNFISFGFLSGFFFGVLSSVVPWFLFMPAMGVGILARKTKHPLRASVLAMLTHIVFGVSMGLTFLYTVSG